MITLATAVAKLQAVARVLADDNPWKRRADELIVRVLTDPVIDTTDEFCDTIEAMSVRTHAEYLGHLWHSWGLDDGQTIGSTGTAGGRVDVADQGRVPPTGAEDPS